MRKQHTAGRLVLLLLVLPALATNRGYAQGLSAAPQSGISLDEAIRRAQENEPAFAAAVAEAGVTSLERKIARASLLPELAYHSQVLYTEPNGNSNRIGQTSNQPAPVFIANNGVREYTSQGVLTETIGLAQIAATRLADADAAIAHLRSWKLLAERGLVATVVSLYSAVQTAAERLAVAQRALDEAAHFVDIAEKREAAREAAHADVLKGQLQLQQRQRELAEVMLSTGKARTELAVLLFPDPSTAYEVTAMAAPALLPEREAVSAAAQQNNPELRSALAALKLSEADTYAARAALLPQLSLNAAYGIDAPQFAVNGPDRTQNLGYSAGATLDIPVWDWLATERRIKQSRLRENAAKVMLTATQRRLLADLTEFYAEAQTAQAELVSLDASLLAARESLRLTNLRYTDGESTVLEVVDAQSTLIGTENAHVDARARYEAALAQLQTLTGRL